jgi:hypothetical protein
MKDGENEDENENENENEHENENECQGLMAGEYRWPLKEKSRSGSTTARAASSA